MDPGLKELYEAGSAQDEVRVIIRLKDKAVVPADVRVISRFGEIVTARLRREDVQRIHDSEEVASMKASWSLSEGAGLYEDYFETGDELGETNEFNDSGSDSIPEDGTGIVVGICDWGFDFTCNNFRNADDTTRLLALWDQSAESDETPAPYGYGRVYTREEINKALTTPDPTAALGYHPGKGDPRGTGAHGTHVSDILAGNRSIPGSEAGFASHSDLLFVHLVKQELRELQNFGDSVSLLEGIDFVRGQAQEKPLVVHFSAGMTGGPHDGTALFAQAVDKLVQERPGVALVQSVGNYASSRMHTHGRIGPDQRKVLYWIISSRDRTPNELEIWYSGRDQFDLALVTPNGVRFEAALGENTRLVHDSTHWGTMYHRRHEPNSGMNHIDIFLRTSSPSGRYRIELRGRDIVDGRFHAWIERDSGGRHQSRFPRKQATSMYTTNTICNSYRGIAVGAVDATAEDRPATHFSSRGPTADGRQKPELVAPGYRIRAARSLPRDGWNGESRFTTKSGTSMAAPHVSGTVALMMQAAGRPLNINEIRRILIGTADPVPGPRGHSSTRLGYGYLNTIAAVEAARMLGGQGVSDESLGAAYADMGDPSMEGVPRWLVDLQPFEHDAMGDYAGDSEDTGYDEAGFDEFAIVEGNEGGFEAAEDGILAEPSIQSEDSVDPGMPDEAYVEPMRDDMRPQEEGYDTFSTNSEDSNKPESELEELTVENGSENEIQGDEDSILIETAMLTEDETDQDVLDEVYDDSISDEMSREEEEEEEARLLTELYEALEELTETGELEGNSVEIPRQIE